MTAILSFPVWAYIAIAGIIAILVVTKKWFMVGMVISIVIFFVVVFPMAILLIVCIWLLLGAIWLFAKVALYLLYMVSSLSWALLIIMVVNRFFPISNVFLQKIFIVMNEHLLLYITITTAFSILTFAYSIIIDAYADEAKDAIGF